MDAAVIGFRPHDALANDRVKLGEAIRLRREAMGMSLSELSREMGGSPAPSFISKIETGRQRPTLQNVMRFADALSAPRDLFLNLGGYATAQQIKEAETLVQRLVGEETPTLVYLPVYDATQPDADPTRLPKRGVLMRTPENAFVIDLTGRANAPYEGEVIASRDRDPVPDRGVVVLVDNKLGAWTYRSTETTGPWIENGNRDRRSKGYAIWGRIVRVTAKTDYD